jgi:2-methylisocitrate lyase-like PEP mutase family enzyme
VGGPEPAGCYNMKRDVQARLAEKFRSRHLRRPLLLLANAWDPMSARIFEAAGSEAIATTSGGLAWALGFPDGEQAPWNEVVAATARIARTVRVPVTADIETGYGETPQQVAANVRDIIGAGAVGINLEDGTHDSAAPMRGVEDAAARIHAARETARAEGVPLVINARVDLYLRRVGSDDTRLAETIKRGKAYLAAGADCIFPFGLVDLAVVAELVRALAAPVNIVGRAGMPAVAEIEAAGVARVSTASGPSLAIMSAMRQMAETLHATGRFDGLASVMKRDDAQRLFATRPDER